MSKYLKQYCQYKKVDIESDLNIYISNIDLSPQKYSIIYIKRWTGKILKDLNDLPIVDIVDISTINIDEWVEVE